MLRLGLRTISRHSLRMPHAARGARSVVMSAPAKSNSALTTNVSLRHSKTAFAAGVAMAALAVAAVVVAEDEESAAAAEAEEKKKQGFKEKKILAYENRLRRFSEPARVFRYFASKQIDEEVYMLPADFVRAVIPGEVQPKGLQLDEYEKMTSEEYNQLVKKSKSFKGHFLKNPTGLLDFSEYLFLLSVMSTPARHFEIAFKMFDLDGNGEVDMLEFNQVQRVISGTKHSLIESDVKARVARSPLLRELFGNDGKKKLNFADFCKFANELQRELLEVEFEKNSEDGTMSERKFAELVLSYNSDQSDYKDYIKRAKKRAKTITKEQWMSFSNVVKGIDDIELALSLYTSANASISKDDLRRAAKAAANIDLDGQVLDFVFNLFDKDGDGALSHREFIAILKKRAHRGIEDRTRSGSVVRGLRGLLICVKEKMISGEVDEM